jgi:hypothetical protein
MASITNKTNLFFVTSPRSPHRMKDEIKFLVDNFSGEVWNPQTQRKFYEELSKQDFFDGSITGDLAFKARDRINRAPKALGFVNLKPISLTEAGREYLYGNRPHEAFLRQLLKFQLHSPYHTDKNERYKIKPYLILMKLIDDLDGLSKNEIALFVIGLIDFSDYEIVKNKILKFREERKTIRERQISYKQLVADHFEKEIKEIYKQDIDDENISTRESDENTIEHFVKTKRGNHIDYADASIRYLRETNLFSLKPRSSKIYLIKEHKKDLEFILKSVSEELYKYKDEDEYKEYLFDTNTPELLTDNKDELVNKILSIETKLNSKELSTWSVSKLKEYSDDIIRQRVDRIVENEKVKLKSYEEYEDVQKVFDEIKKKEIVDAPLFFEWNIWRAFSMLNDGDIEGYFKVDDDGVPLYTAPGNTADITCKYDNFNTIVEVTLSGGRRQYDMEGEPVARHYGDFKRSSNKDKVYGIFIAPIINEATIAHYFMLYRTNIEYYGGKAQIIPIGLDDFKLLLKNAYNSPKRPKSGDLELLFTELASYAEHSSSETEWYTKVSDKVKTAFA